MHSVLLTLVLPAVAAQGPGNEAQRLYFNLEKRLVAADTARASFTLQMEGFGMDGVDFKGSFEFGPGNEARMEYTVDLKGQALIFKATSDGTKLRVFQECGWRGR